MRAGKFFMIGIMLHIALAAGATAAPALVRETLNYQVSLGPWDDVARVQLVFTEVAPGRYLAEFSGAAQGMWKLLSRWLPERYQTEMVYRDGRLVPVVFREEFLSKGQRVKKEYRFDNEQARLALWRQADGQDPVKKWEIPLQGPVYDLLSLFYNVRLGAFGPLPGGSALKVAVLPTPEPQELVFRIGPATEQGRKVMVNHRPPESSETNQYFIYINSQQVPTQAWTRVTLFGKLSGCLLNAGEINQEGLLALSPCPAPELNPRP
jgi:hypothetical protein